MEKNTENLYLVYVEKITEQATSKGMYEYEFFFSKTPEIVWGVDWNQQCPSSCSRENMRPDPTTYTLIERLWTIIPFACIEDNSCFSCQDMVDGIVACAWEDISEYEEYPEPFRLVFNFGESYESVESKLAQRHQFFSPKGSQNNENNNESEDGREIDTV